MANAAYSLPSPYLPIEFKKNGIPQLWIGWIFVFYSIGIVVVSPLVPKLIGRYGRRAPVMSGLVLMGISFIQFGLL